MPETIQQIKLSEIRESPFNPRKHFDEVALRELAASIAAQGMLQPLVVRPGPTKNDENKIMLPAYYELVLGERRFRAASLLEDKKLAKTLGGVSLDAVPCIVRDMTDTAAREAQLVENAQREGISALEEAEAFAGLQKTVPDTREIATRVGKSVRYVEVAIQLLQLTAPVKKALGDGKLQRSYAQELLPLKPEQQKEALQNITDEWNPITSVKDLRAFIGQEFREKPKPSKADLEREKRLAEESKKYKAQREAQAKKSTEERKFNDQVNDRMLRALWPKLQTANAEDVAWFTDLVVEDSAGNASLSEAMVIAEGKKFEHASWNAVKKAFAKIKPAKRLAVAILSRVASSIEYMDPKEQAIWRWAKIDRKKILAQLKAAAAQTSAKGKRDAAAQPKTKKK